MHSKVSAEYAIAVPWLAWCAVQRTRVKRRSISSHLGLKSHQRACDDPTLVGRTYLLPAYAASMFTMRAAQASHGSDDGNGVNFALFSAHATKVELRMFDETRENEKSNELNFPDVLGSDQ
jgi:hypothetical protein